MDTYESFSIEKDSMEFAISGIGSQTLEAERQAALFEVVVRVVVTGRAEVLQLIQSSLL